MVESKHYCADCQTHFGGSPNYVTPEEHADIAHGGGWFRGIANGDFRDWTRRHG